MKYAIITAQRYSENTGAYGYCDYADFIPYIALVVEAVTVRKAQNAAKKVFPNIRFGGNTVALPETYENMDFYKKPADPMLSSKAQELHNAALEALA